METLYSCEGTAPVDLETSYQHAIQEDYANNPNSGVSDRTKRSIGTHSKFWAQHRTLKISFLSEHTKFINLVKSTIELWTPHINLNIEFVEKTEAADIRISDSKDLKGHWSNLGTDALSVPADKPTMHFDITETHSVSVWKSYILHEFGHALGLEHEHQHPDANIDWVTPVVYRTYKEQSGWPQEQTYDNIFKKLDRSKTTSAPYDQKSIMHYSFPAPLIWDNIAIPPNFTLSEKDISFIRSIYPPKEQA